MKTKFSGILTLILALVAQLTFAQGKAVSGSVSDDSGMPVAGVNIVVQGTTTGTQSDFDGNYSIMVDEGSVLSFTYVGYTSVTVTVGSSDTVNVTMGEDVAQLEEVVGQNRVKVNVSASMRFDHQTIKEELIDPDQTSVVSEQTVDESSTGSRSIPDGPAGVTTYLPEATGREAATVSEFTKKNSTKNYESSRREVFKESASGEVTRLSVSVLLDNIRPQILDEDGNFLGRDNIRWTEAEKEVIEGLVKAAMGFSSKRADSIFVGNMPFEKAAEQDKSLEIEQARIRNQFILDVVRYVSLGIAIVALIMLVIRPMVQRLASKPADLDLLMGLPATIGELEGEELEIPTERESGIPPREKILDLAKQDPLKTSALIRGWLRDTR